MFPITISFQINGEVTVITYSGNRMMPAPKTEIFAGAIEALTTTDIKTLIINLAVGYGNSDVIGQLFRLIVLAKKREKNIGFVSVDRRMAELFALTKFNTEAKIFRSVNDAIKHFTPAT